MAINKNSYFIFTSHSVRRTSLVDKNDDVRRVGHPFDKFPNPRKKGTFLIDIRARQSDLFWALLGD